MPGFWPTQAAWSYNSEFGAPTPNHPMASYFPQDMLYELWCSYNTPPGPTNTAPTQPTSGPIPSEENPVPNAEANQEAGPPAGAPPPDIPPTSTPPAVASPAAVPPIMTYFSVVHTVQYSPWSPTLGDGRAESVVIGTCGTLHEANELAMKEVYEKYGNLAHIRRAAWDPPSPTWLRKAGSGQWPNTWKIEDGKLSFSLVNMLLQYPPRRLHWQDENQSRHASSYYPTASGHQLIANPLPYYDTSMMRNTFAPTLSPQDRAPPPDGLPALTPSLLSYGPARRLQNDISTSFSTKETEGPSYLTRILQGKYFDRLSKLEDEVYPLKLVRELARISDRPSLGKEKSVFGVIHVNTSGGKDLIVENIGTYTTAKAANNRALDFWDQKYGTGNPTGFLLNANVDAIVVKFDHIEEPDNHSFHTSRRQNPNYPSLSGILEDSSNWVITNNCLSLSHKSVERERRVYVVISHLRDQGIHD
ncbi:hypothetical protein O1611_g7382 [Lasiodiplodia mahajangana]|uniref:Uncharacterized protein n=1 Tax=Lasiodiplodia mahajangana TaxID=1108764 RepID=A0ACC2JFG7_9PEZI|nr:hypothetical protein O1611_g7382 [Lasiodiplodia mahajangana]